MGDRTVFRVGGWAAIIGGVLAVVVNVVSPRGSADDLGDPTAFVSVAATTTGWELIQTGVVVALLLLLAGFYAITKSIEDVPAKTWTRFGLGAVTIGTTIGVAAFAINAGLLQGGEAIGSDVVSGIAFYVGGGLFNAWTLVYFGLGAGLYGMALAASNRYPTWLGWVTVLAGLVGLISGFMNVLAGATEVSTFVLFPISSGVLTLVIIYLGVLLLRDATPATTSTPEMS